MSEEFATEVDISVELIEIDVSDEAGQSDPGDEPKMMYLGRILMKHSGKNSFEEARAIMTEIKRGLFKRGYSFYGMIGDGKLIPDLDNEKVLQANDNGATLSLVLQSDEFDIDGHDLAAHVSEIYADEPPDSGRVFVEREVAPS